MRSMTVFHSESEDSSRVVCDVARELRAEVEESIRAMHHGWLARLRAVAGHDEEPRVFVAAWDHTPTTDGAREVRHVAVFEVSGAHEEVEEEARACDRPPDRELVIRERDLQQPSLESRLKTFVDAALHH